MVMLAAALLLAATPAGPAWQALPAEARMSRVFFGCMRSVNSDYYSVLLSKDGALDEVRMQYVPVGARNGRDIVLTGALQSLSLQETAEAIRYRAIYRGNDAAGVPTRLTVIMTAPQPAAQNGVRTATFTLVQGSRSVTQDCSAAPPPPEPVR